MVMLKWVAALRCTARLAQSVERKALNLVVVGSSPTVGVKGRENGREGCAFSALQD